MDGRIITAVKCGHGSCVFLTSRPSQMLDHELQVHDSVSLSEPCMAKETEQGLELVDGKPKLLLRRMIGG